MQSVIWESTGYHENSLSAVFEVETGDGGGDWMFRTNASDNKAVMESGARRLKLLATFSVLAVVMAMIVAVGLFSACDDSDAVDASGVTVDDKQFDSITKALEEVNEGTIKLNSDVSDSFEVSTGKVITVDLNGKKLTLTGAVSVKGTLTIIDSSVKAGPVYQNGNVNYTSGEIVCGKGMVMDVEDGGKIVINSGTIRSTDTVYKSAVRAFGDCTSKDATSIGSTIIMNGGFVEAQEFCLVAQGVGARLVVNGGLCHSKDNAVLGGNGTSNATRYCGGTYMEVNGGTFISDIQSSGYVACGIYHPQAGTLVVNGGSFIVNNGVGILMRGGTLTMNGGEITTTGTTTGKVGDSRVVVACSSVFIDLDAKYYDCANVSVKINGGSFVSEVGALNGYGQYSSMYAVTGGKFCTSVSDFVTGGSVETYADGVYTVGKPYDGGTIEADTNEVSVVDVKKDVAVSVGEDTKTSIAISSTSNMGSVSVSVDRNVTQSTTTPNAQLKITLEVTNTITGYMDITVSMSVPSGYKPVVNYLNDDGTVESMEIRSYGTDYVTFRTYHNSEYELGTTEYRETIIIDDDDDYYPIVPVTPASTSSNDDDTKTIVACAAAAVAAALAVAFFLTGLCDADIFRRTSEWSTRQRARRRTRYVRLLIRIVREKGRTVSRFPTSGDK